MLNPAPNMTFFFWLLILWILITLIPLAVGLGWEEVQAPECPAGECNFFIFPPYLTVEKHCLSASGNQGCFYQQEGHLQHQQNHQHPCSTHFPVFLLLSSMLAVQSHRGAEQTDLWRTQPGWSMDTWCSCGKGMWGGKIIVHHKEAGIQSQLPSFTHGHSLPRIPPPQWQGPEILEYFLCSWR